jgi:hypothetical protein
MTGLVTLLSILVAADSLSPREVTGTNYSFLDFPAAPLKDRYTAFYVKYDICAESHKQHLWRI